MTTKKLAKNYEYVIVDPGVTGLLLSHLLTTQGKHVLLVETRNVLGPQNIYVETSKGRLHGHFQYVPNTEVCVETLKWLGEILQDRAIESEDQIQSVTVDSGKLSQFVGFGDQKFKTLDELSRFNTSDNIKLSSQPEVWIEQLSEMLTCDRINEAEVTELVIEDNTVKGIVINGSKLINGDNFIYGDSLKNLMEIIPMDFVASKVRQRIAKLKPWSKVSLHLTHTETISDSNDLHFLMGSNTDFEPVVGQFFTANQDGSQDSIWFTLVTSEQVEDAEFLGSVLKNMKRQIKRAYENLFDNIENEKLVIQNDSNGHYDLGLKAPFQLTGLDNFYVSHRLMASQTGFAGQVEVAKSLYEQVFTNN